MAAVVAASSNRLCSCSAGDSSVSFGSKPYPVATFMCYSTLLNIDGGLAEGDGTPWTTATSTIGGTSSTADGPRKNSGVGSSKFESI
jgi:hypothetical protein